MTRLDIERQERLEPLRIQTAMDSFKELNLPNIEYGEKMITFEWKESVIQYYPYTGWASGKTIKDGRGLKRLLKQLK